MADNQIRRTGVDPAAKADGKSGYNVDPGPYEAIVVKHVEGTRMGQMLVYIPDFGGVQTDEGNQILVSYCSPFYGTTFNSTYPPDPNSAFTTGQSYGMWMVPPDVGNKVLVIFAAGDRSRGYWIGCIYDSSSHHMVPGNARNIGGESNRQIDNAQSGPLGSQVSADSVLPVVEYSTDTNINPTAFSPDGLTATPRIAHPVQSAILVGQGLDRDPVRGAISSSSMREAPSNVYGISTPGRSVTNGAQQVGAVLANAVSAEQVVKGRIGGHTFVMDDGAADGSDRLIRLRTAGGHQILMNDVADKTAKGGAGVLYIASASGNQWIEFSSDGSINIFGAAGFNVRTEGALNLHSDSAVNINSGGSVNIYGEMGVKVGSLTSVDISGLVSASMSSDGFASVSAGGYLNLAGGASCSIGSVGDTSITGAMILLNSGKPAIPKPVVPTIPNLLPDVAHNGSNWQLTPGAVGSICSVVPAHEPWIDPATKLRPTPAMSSLLGAGIGAAASLGAGVAGKFL